MKKSLLFLQTVLLLCLFGCANQVSQSEHKSSKTEQEAVQKGVLEGKAIYSNSRDNSTINIVLDKSDGLLTNSLLNAYKPEKAASSSRACSRNVVSSQKCSSDGSYKFTDLEEGLYTVYAISADSTEKAVYRNVKVTYENNTEVPQLILTATGSLSGKVTLDNSTDNNTGFVVFAAGTSYMATTAADGLFTISGLPASTDYQIVIMKGNYVYLWKSNVQALAFKDTDIGEINFESSDIISTAKDGTDGKDGVDGTPIIWKGSFEGESVTELKDPEYLWAYYNTEDGCSYIYDGSKWTLLASSARRPDKNETEEDNTNKYEKEIMALTESGTISINGDLSQNDLNNLRFALKNKYSSDPEIKISLDFSETTSVEEINYYQLLNDCYSLEEIKVSDALLKKYANLFGGSKTIKKVVICDGVEEIPEEAFRFCTNLQSILIPDSVKTIGKNAFFNCKSLKSIIIPAGVTSLDTWPFSSCSQLFDIYNLSNQYIDNYGSDLHTIHSSLDEPSVVSRTNDGFMFIKKMNDNQYYLVGYDGSEKEITLPDSFEAGDNTIVTEYKIYPSAFNCYNNLTSITIPSAVTDIGEYAFSNCINLESVAIQEGITEIKEYTFSYCEKLKNITIPQTVTSIGNDAFSYCKSLTDITMPDKLSSLGSSVFDNCISLKNITIPSGITNLLYGVFYNCDSLSSIIIPDTVKDIDGYAFRYCKNLAKVVIPAGVKSIGNEAFYGCYKLFDVYNLSSLDFVMGSNDYGYITYYAKAIHTSLDESPLIYTTKDGFIFIKENNQYYLYSYTQKGTETDIIFPEYFELEDNTKITEYGIYKSAFDNCSNIRSIKLSSGVTSIGQSAFFYCTKLAKVIIPADSKLKSIESRAFSGCQRLMSITIPASVTSIGQYAFEDCKSLVEIYNLSKVSVSATIKHTSLDEPSKIYITDDGLCFYEDSGNCYCFTYIGTKSEIVFPDSIELNNKKITSYSIKSYAFNYLYNIKSVTLSPAVTSIGEHAFDSCGITEITIPSSIKSIGRYAFYSCSNLKNMTISGIWKYSNNNSDSIFVTSSCSKSDMATVLKTLYNYTWTRIQ